MSRTLLNGRCISIPHFRLVCFVLFLPLFSFSLSLWFLPPSCRYLSLHILQTLKQNPINDSFFFKFLRYDETINARDYFRFLIDWMRVVLSNHLVCFIKFPGKIFFFRWMNSWISSICWDFLWCLIIWYYPDILVIPRWCIKSI